MHFIISLVTLLLSINKFVCKIKNNLVLLESNLRNRKRLEGGKTGCGSNPKIAILKKRSSTIKNA